MRWVRPHTQGGEETPARSDGLDPRILQDQARSPGLRCSDFLAPLLLHPHQRLHTCAPLSSPAPLAGPTDAQAPSTADGRGLDAADATPTPQLYGGNPLSSLSPRHELPVESLPCKARVGASTSLNKGASAGQQAVPG